MRHPVSLLSVCILATLAVPAFAASLNGSSVTGSIHFDTNPKNYFDSGNFFVPAGYGNSLGSTTVTIGSAVEFGFADSLNLDTANFDASTLVLADLAKTTSDNSAITYVFTDPAFTSFHLVSSSDAGVTFSFVGDTLTVNIPAETLAAGQTQSVVLSEAAPIAAAPEPGGLVLLGTGLLGIAGTMRRRFLRA